MVDLKRVWMITFGLWAALGFIFNGFLILQAFNKYQIGVGESAFITMLITFWIGGLIVFGLSYFMYGNDGTKPAVIQNMDNRKLDEDSW